MNQVVTYIDDKKNEEYITEIRKIKSYTVSESGVIEDVVYEEKKNT